MILFSHHFFPTDAVSRLYARYHRRRDCHYPAMNHETKQIWQALRDPKSGEEFVRADSPSVLRIPGEQDFVFSSDRYPDLQRICELHNAEDYTDEQIRDWYAGQALLGQVSTYTHASEHAEAIAKNSFDIADAMMAERKKRQTPSVAEVTKEYPVNPS